MKRIEFINKYIEFFKSKKHKQIPNSSLIPENDPTVLFTTAGMHPLVPYLLGQPHPMGNRLVNVQKCIRTGDIEEVGDDFHLTFFEMLGNWSLGDYFKEEAIKYSYEFLTKILKIPQKEISVTCFAGDKDAPKDTESEKSWKSLGITKIKFLPKKDNWWGPAGTTGPCGPDTEMFVNNCEIWNDVFMQYNKDKRLILVDGMNCIYDEKFNINKELLDIINNLNTHCILVVNKFKEKGKNLIKNYESTKDTNWEAFSLEEKKINKENPEYFKILLKNFNLTPQEVIYFDHNEKNVETAIKLGILSKHYTNIESIKKFIEENLKAYIPLKQKNVDTGMGVERTLAILTNKKSVYETEAFEKIINKIEKLSNKKYNENKETTKSMRIIADHIKASVFILNEQIPPSNSEQGYVLRRLIRRAILYCKKLKISSILSIAESVFETYPDYNFKKDFIKNELKQEENKFLKTIETGLRIFDKLSNNKTLSGKDAFLLYQSYGFPLELTLEIAKEKNIKINEKEYNEELNKHQELSRTATQGKFKSGLADNSEATKKLHTATHLLNQALREVLKDNSIYQKGSNITPERLRFDFNFPRKLTDKELKEIEELVNKKIKQNIPIICNIMDLEKAKKTAKGVFEDKYGEKVSVYGIGDFSKEICSGPHVSNTKELGKFKILKEESSSAGVRRIKATVE
ncbi:MAG: alanine--tRNA ligase-related protein [Candidatus Pacearchaeota archaeon]